MKTYILSAPNQLHGEDGSFWDADAALCTTLWGSGRCAHCWEVTLPPPSMDRSRGDWFKAISITATPLQGVRLAPSCPRGGVAYPAPQHPERLHLCRYPQRTRRILPSSTTR